MSDYECIFDNEGLFFMERGVLLFSRVSDANVCVYRGASANEGCTRTAI